MEKVKCKNPVMFRYTWAGQDEAFCCVIHGVQISRMAQAMGYPLQFIQLSPSEMVEASCENEEPAVEEEA